MENISKQRRAKNEVAFREYNEKIHRLSRRILDSESRHNLPIRFICECSNAECAKPIEIVLSAYEQLRLNPRCFIVVPGHEQVDIETKVDKLGGYTIVEKRNDLPAAI